MVTVFLFAGLYLLILVGIGFYSGRHTQNDREDYFVASRSLGAVVLFAAVLGTNVSTFLLMGLPGFSYHAGIGVFGLVAVPASTGAALTYFLGYRVWKIAREHRFVSPCELYRARWNSDGISILMFIVFSVYTIPYITLGQIGGGAILQNLTGGAVPYWLGSLIMTLVVGYYVWNGGMRATAWTNVFQVAVFTLAIIILFSMIVDKAGGFSAITQQLLKQKPELLQRAGIPAVTPKVWLSQFVLFSILPFGWATVFVRFLSAKGGRELKKSSINTPLMILVLDLLVILLGLWGAVLVPGLVGSQSDNIAFILMNKYLPLWTGGLMLVAILALAQSTMDAQVLTISQLFTTDIMQPYFRVTSEKAPMYGRVSMIVLLVACYVLALIKPGNVYSIANVSFTGTSAMVPVMIGGIFWPRLNKTGALAGLLAGSISVPLLFFGVLPKFGFLPIIPALVLSTAGMIIGTLLTTKNEAEKVLSERFFAPLAGRKSTANDLSA